MSNPSAAPGAAAAKVLKVVCFGDSITGQPDHRKFMKWSDVLACMLEARLGPGRAGVLNRGIAGDTTAGALARLEGDVIAEKPDVVTVLLGGNDMHELPASAQAVAQARAKDNLQAMIARIRAAGAKTLVLQYHVIPNPASPQTAWTHLPLANPCLAAAAAANGAPVLALNEIMAAAYANGSFTELAGRDASGAATWKAARLTQEHLVSAVDGVHLNPGGELVFARAVFAKLVELGWLP